MTLIKADSQQGLKPIDKKYTTIGMDLNYSKIKNKASKKISYK